MDIINDSKKDKCDIAEELWKRAVKRFDHIKSLRENYNEKSFKKLQGDLKLTKKYFDFKKINFDSNFKNSFHKLFYQGFQVNLVDHPNNIDILETSKLMDDFEEYVKIICDKKEEGENKNLPINFSGDYVEGDKIEGDKVGGDKKIGGTKLSWIGKYWWYFIIPLIIGIILLAIENSWFNNNILTNVGKSELEATTILNESIFSIIYKSDEKKFSSMLDKQNYFERYYGMNTKIERAFVKHIEKNEENINVLLQAWYGGKSISLYCLFNKNQEKKLLGINEDDLIEFSGKIEKYENGLVIIENCAFE